MNARGIMRGIGTSAKHFAQGLRSETSTTVGDVGVAVGMARRAFSKDDAVRAAQRGQARAVADFVKEHPGEAAKQFGKSLADPVMAEIRAGRPAAAAGRGVVLLAGVVLPGVGAEKLIRLGRVGAAATDDAAAGAQAVAKAVR